MHPQAYVAGRELGSSIVTASARVVDASVTGALTVKHFVAGFASAFRGQTKAEALLLAGGFLILPGVQR